MLLMRKTELTSKLSDFCFQPRENSRHWTHPQLLRLDGKYEAVVSVAFREGKYQSRAPEPAWLSAQGHFLTKHSCSFTAAKEEELPVPSCRNVWNLQARVAEGQAPKVFVGS